MSIKIKGFDEFERSLKALERRAKSLEGPHRVALNELFSPSFMRHHTKFSSFEALLRASPWPVETAEDFLAIPDRHWDRFVRERTSFETWEEMQVAASQVWVTGRLGV